MSPELLRRALRETRFTRHLASHAPVDNHARWPRDYWRAVDRPMIHWLRTPLERL